nr:unnamed protein product [Callosobruchus analis]
MLRSSALPLHSQLPNLRNIFHNDTRRRQHLHFVPHKSQRVRPQGHSSAEDQLLALRGAHQALTMHHPHHNQLLVSQDSVQGQKTETGLAWVRLLSSVFHRQVSQEENFKVR